MRTSDGSLICQRRRRSACSAPFVPSFQAPPIFGRDSVHGSELMRRVLQLGLAAEGPDVARMRSEYSAFFFFEKEQQTKKAVRVGRGSSQSHQSDATAGYFICLDHNIFENTFFRLFSVDRSKISTCPKIKKTP